MSSGEIVTQTKLLMIAGVDSLETLARICMDGVFQMIQNLVGLAI